MPPLTLCPNLKKLIFSCFGFFDTDLLPLRAIEKVRQSNGKLNPANDAIFIGGLHRLIMHAVRAYGCPMSLQQIRGILRSEDRTFNVPVGVEVVIIESPGAEPSGGSVGFEVG